MDDSQVSRLYPLRIPGGWLVKFNIFVEEEPIIEDGRFINADAFSEDLLSLEYAWTEHDGKSAQIVLDLGWYPAGDINGQYILRLVRDSYDNVLKTFESKSRNDVANMIEEWVGA